MGRMSELHAYITENIRLFPNATYGQRVDMVAARFDISCEHATKFVDQVIQGDKEDGHNS